MLNAMLVNMAVLAGFLLATGQKTARACGGNLLRTVVNGQNALSPRRISPGPAISGKDTAKTALAARGIRPADCGFEGWSPAYAGQPFRLAR